MCAWLGVMFQQVVRMGWLRPGRGGYTLSRRSSLSDAMHANAKLTPRMRAHLVQFHQSAGHSLRRTAASFAVSEQPVRKWLKRPQAAAFPARWQDRSSRPHRQPRKTSTLLEAQLLSQRRQLRSYATIL